MCVCVCVCVCVCACVRVCVCRVVCTVYVSTSRGTLDLAVGMPLQVETLQKEVQHLRKASMFNYVKLSHHATHMQCIYSHM